MIPGNCNSWRTVIKTPILAARGASFEHFLFLKLASKNSKLHKKKHEIIFAQLRLHIHYWIISNFIRLSHLLSLYETNNLCHIFDPNFSQHWEIIFGPNIKFQIVKENRCTRTRYLFGLQCRPQSITSSSTPENFLKMHLPLFPNIDSFITHSHTSSLHASKHLWIFLQFNLSNSYQVRVSRGEGDGEDGLDRRALKLDLSHSLHEAVALLCHPQQRQVKAVRSELHLKQKEKEVLLIMLLRIFERQVFKFWGGNKLATPI